MAEINSPTYHIKRNNYNLQLLFYAFCQRLRIPWKHIMTSVPMWALIIAHVGQNWGYWTLLTEIPSYMTGVLNFRIEQVGDYLHKRTLFFL